MTFLKVGCLIIRAQKVHGQISVICNKTAFVLLKTIKKKKKENAQMQKKKKNMSALAILLFYKNLFSFKL